MNLSIFLEETKYVDFNTPNIVEKAKVLFEGLTEDVSKIIKAYEFVRDEIPHAFDIEGKLIGAKASEVLAYGMGICHSKSNLLAALLRSQGIPTGFCFEHLTLVDDDSAGYCVHCFNAVFLKGKWIKLDARGNKPGIAAKFSLEESILAYPPRAQYDEYFWPGIYAKPQQVTMDMLERVESIEEIFEQIVDYLEEKPDVLED